MLSALSSYFVQKRETGNAIFLASVEYIFDYCLFCDRYELTRIDTLNSSELTVANSDRSDALQAS